VASTWLSWVALALACTSCEPKAGEAKVGAHEGTATSESTPTATDNGLASATTLGVEGQVAQTASAAEAARTDASPSQALQDGAKIRPGADPTVPPQPQMSSQAKLEATHAVTEWLGKWVAAHRGNNGTALRSFYRESGVAVALHRPAGVKSYALDEWLRDLDKILGTHNDLRVDRVVVAFESGNADDARIDARLSPEGSPSEKSVELSLRIKADRKHGYRIDNLTLTQRPMAWWKSIASERPGYVSLSCPPVAMDMHWRTSAVPGEINGVAGDPPSQGYLSLRCANDDSAVIALPRRGNIAQWSAPKGKRARVVAKGHANESIADEKHEIVFQLSPTQIRITTTVISVVESEEMVDGEVVESHNEWKESDEAALFAYPLSSALRLDCQGSTLKPNAAQASAACIGKTPVIAIPAKP
jgi:hypothetical protein